MTPSFFPSRWRRAICAVAAAATAVALAPSLATAAAATPPDQMAHDSIQAALSSAAATDQPVTASDETTPFSVTVAQPDGTLQTTLNAVPVRVQQAGVWTPVDATLQHNTDGTYSPAAAMAGLRLSGGGDGPLAVIDNHGDVLSLSWPDTLPTPTIEGATATYADVLPGVDLAVTASTMGGLSEIFVVKTPAAAQDPGLDRLHFTTSTSGGVTLSADQAGNLTGTDADGTVVFHAPTPIMWDSPATGATQPSGTAAASGALQASGTDAETTPSDSGDPATAPPAGATIAPVDIDATGDALQLTPDAGMLASSDTNYPVYIDPTVNPDWNKDRAPKSGWDWVQEANPNTSWWQDNSNGNPAVGYQGWDPSFQGRNRSYFQFDVSQFDGADIQHADLDALETDTGLFDCSAEYAIMEASTGQIDTHTTWNNQPARFDAQQINPVKGASEANGCPNVHALFGVTATLKNDGNGVATFRLSAPDGHEDERNYYRRFSGPDTKLVVDWNRVPNTPTDLEMSPSPRPAGLCGSTGWINATDHLTLSAKVSDPDGSGQNLWGEFHMWDKGGDGTLTGGTTVEADSKGVQGSKSGVPVSGDVGTGILIDGHEYGTDARTFDSIDRSPTTDHCYFWYDKTKPREPDVSSDDFNLTNSSQHVNQQGTFQLHSSDPTPNTGRASGIDHFIYSLSSEADLDNDGGKHVSATGQYATITLAPTVWGINYLFVAAVDNAGNQSDAYRYAFYVPDDITAEVEPGDVDGDAHPDLVAGNKANGNLYIIPTTENVQISVASLAEDSPDLTSWANTLTAHRSSAEESLSGNRYDDLWAHKSGSSTMYLYLNNNFNAGHTAGDPVYDSEHVGVVERATTCSAPANCDTDYNSTWAAVTQMIAPGDVNHDGNPDLITVENGNLWLFLSNNVTGAFGDAQMLQVAGAAPQPNWNDWRIIAPGDDTGPDAGSDPANPSYTPDLWAAYSQGSDGEGTIRLYPINYDRATRKTSLGSPQTNINGAAAAWGPDHRRLLASPGDSNGDCIPDIFSITTGNPSQLWENRGTSRSADTLTFSPHHVLDDGKGTHNWDNYTNLS